MEVAGAGISLQGSEAFELRPRPRRKPGFSEDITLTIRHFHCVVVYQPSETHTTVSYQVVHLMACALNVQRAC